MSDSEYKRRHERTDDDSVIIYASEDKEFFFGAQMRNYSESGMYFESEWPLEPGLIIYTMRSTPDADYVYYRPDAPQSRDSEQSLARVRWCRKIEHDEGLRFGIGIEYETKD